MTDIISKQSFMSNSPIYSVSEISIAIKKEVESKFGRIRVRGEISGFKNVNGHLYFTLKDEKTVLDSVCFKGTSLKLAPEDGLEILALGRLTTYGPRSKYQIIIESIELAGEGALLKLLKDRKKKLDAEGLFDNSKKRYIPFLPDTIGVVTSPTGAVIKDILHRINDRFGRHIILWPVPVQGQDAATKIASAIDGFNSLNKTSKITKPDLLIIARGGGSLEDLWAFNEEIVVRAVASSSIPIISAVGHEVDTTLIDYAADKRAPTPSAAAEMAVPVRREVLARLLDCHRRQVSAANRIIKDFNLNLEITIQKLPNLLQITEGASQRLDDWDERLRNALRSSVKERVQMFLPMQKRLIFPKHLIIQSQKILANTMSSLDRVQKQLIAEKILLVKNLSGLLESYSYERILDRGFALLRNRENKAISSTTNLKTGDEISAILHDGTKNLLVLGRKLDQQKMREKANSKPKQGTLI